MIINILNYLKDNINWIKDLLIAIFSGLAILIAFLTYLRAKHTILQPVRSEVIKKQSELLTELLEDISIPKKGGEIDDLFDYVEMSILNVNHWVINYGFITENFDELKEITSKLSQGFIYIGKNKKINDVKLVSTFPGNTPKESKKDINSLGKKLFENGLRGQISIDKIYFTEKFNESFSLIQTYYYNPFMPNKIQIIINQLLSDVNQNIHLHLKEALEAFFSDFFYKHKNQSNFIFSPIGVFNKFNHKRIHHGDSLKLLRSEIRKYLRIDEMP